MQGWSWSSRHASIRKTGGPSQNRHVGDPKGIERCDMYGIVMAEMGRYLVLTLLWLGHDCIEKLAEVNGQPTARHETLLATPPTSTTYASQGETVVINSSWRNAIMPALSRSLLLKSLQHEVQ
jgi:hypothetical protein